MKKFILITLLCALVVFGCEDKSDTHTHTWGEWQYNETEHWKECTANDGAEYGRANHTGDPCTVCGYETPKPHESTITAFGKTAKVIGDASISTDDFNTAKGKLQEAMTAVDNDFNNLSTSEKAQFTNIMDRGITIVIGNTVPACVNRALTVGVDYLKSNTITKFVGDILVLIDDNAFAG